MWLSIDFEMAAWVVETAIVFDMASLGLHVEVEQDGLLGELIKRPFTLVAFFAIKNDVDGSCSVLLLVYEFEDLLGLLNVTKHELSRHSPKEEKIA